MPASRSQTKIRALARNGSILNTTKTDITGHAKLPALEGFINERLPVAVLADKEGDTSFLPFNERQLPAMDFSRFDITGVLASRIKAVEAFVFTERGVYRPGDTIHAGVMTRRRDWQPVLEGLPLAITIRDPRGQVGNQTIRLPYDGFFACDFPLGEAAALGLHEIEANVLDHDNKVLFRLGRAAVRAGGIPAGPHESRRQARPRAARRMAGLQGHRGRGFRAIALRRTRSRPPRDDAPGVITRRLRLPGMAGLYIL